MTQDARELAFSVLTRERVQISMAQRVGKDLQSDLASLGRLNGDVLDLEWLIGSPRLNKWNTTTA
jgi:hypothetical protein